MLNSLDFLLRADDTSSADQLAAPFMDVPFLSHSLVIMILYVWSRRNPFEQLQLYGLITVGAAFLPYVLVGLSLMMGQHPSIDLLGIAVGHLYYYLVDVLPVVYGFEPLKTPKVVTMFFP